MDTRRGPDYAHDLTERERLDLDRLLAAVAGPVVEPVPTSVPGTSDTRLRSGRTSTRRRLSARFWLPVAAGVAAVATLLAVGSARFLVEPSDPEPPADDRSIARVLDTLATAAGRGTQPPPADPKVRRKTLELTAKIKPGTCTFDALNLEVRLAADAYRPDSPGWLTVERVTVPPTLAARVGCPSTSQIFTPGPPQLLHDAETADLSAAWSGVRRASGDLAPYANPVGIVDPTHGSGHRPVADLPKDAAALDRSLTDRCQPASVAGCTEQWWNLLTEVLTSPRADPGLRRAALAAAARHGGAVFAGDVATDLLGRTGVTIRVPYVHHVNGRSTTADLTLDPVTGTVLQRRIDPPPDYAVTIFTLYSVG